MPLEFDHIVFACASLAQGEAYIQSALGVPAQTGGQHIRLGTHNILLSLGPECFLELIAIDPNGNVPFQPRWFGLDDPTLQAQIVLTPKLVHWVARCGGAPDEIERCNKPVQGWLGPVHSMQRGDFNWRITIPELGTPALGGLVPTLIQWDVPEPPFKKLIDRGVRLTRLQAITDRHAEVSQALQWMGAHSLIELAPGGGNHLIATFSTPSGERVIRS